MRRAVLMMIALTMSLVMQAQYVVSDKYDLWFEDTLPQWLFHSLRG